MSTIKSALLMEQDDALQLQNAIACEVLLFCDVCCCFFFFSALVRCLYRVVFTPCDFLCLFLLEIAVNNCEISAMNADNVQALRLQR